MITFSTTTTMANNASNSTVPAAEGREASTNDKKKKEAWGDSEAKSILRVGILSGIITPQMKPKKFLI